MMNTPQPNTVSLQVLIGWMREGRFVIPDFQRAFEWQPGDIRDLTRSIFQDYYVGNLLFWKAKKDTVEKLACEPIFGQHGTGNAWQIVLDGQQRLTAMHYAFTAPDLPLPGRANRYAFFVRVDRFLDELEEEAFDYRWGKGETNLILNDAAYQYSRHIFPLSMIGSTDAFALSNWLNGYRQFWQNSDDESAAEGVRYAERFSSYLSDLVQQYQFTYIALDEEIEIDKVCNIFTQINSKGVRLNVFDLMNALLVPRNLRLKEMWRGTSPAFEHVDNGKFNVYALQTMSVFRQSYCSPKYLYYLIPGETRTIRDEDGTRKEVLIDSAEDFQALWDRSIDAMCDAIERLFQPQEFGVTSSRFLPYHSIVPSLAALLTRARESDPNARSSSLRKVKSWYWASVFLNRYSSSVDSTTARDWQDIRSWIENDDAKPNWIDEAAESLAGIDLISERSSSSSIYNGVFNLLVINGASDWVTGAIPIPEELDDHHIVPASWGKENGLSQEINTVLNRAPLTAETNRSVIGSRLPNEYLREWIAERGEEEVRSILETHLISREAFDILLRDPFGPGDYDDFVRERQKLIRREIHEAVFGATPELPENLQQLDNRIEAAELALRRIIARRIQEGEEMLPPHVEKKIDDRVAIETRRDPSFNPESIDNVEKKLEFADLRELQDTLQAKKLWPLFEDIFLNKETMGYKFGEIAGLRNAIRHSRHASELTIKEGDAALAWFDSAISRADSESIADAVD